MTTQKQSQYHEILPPPSLTGKIVCLWTQEINTTGGLYRHFILPDGCSDVVWIGDMEPMVAGPATHCILATLPAGTIITGARFQPGWTASFLGLPANELLNQHVLLDDISNATAKQLSEQVCRHQSKTSKLDALAAALQSHLNKVPHAGQAIQTCIAWLIGHPAGRISDLSSLTGLSNRQIRRKFHNAVGYGPKTFQRIMRFQRFLKLSGRLSPDHQNLANLTYNAGYSDQAHMCREVKSLADETPQVLLKNNSVSTLAMSDLFNTKGSQYNYVSL